MLFIPWGIYKPLKTCYSVERSEHTMNSSSSSSFSLANHLDTRFSATAFIALVGAIICAIGIYTLPETVSGKNSPIEYAQLMLLILGAAFCFTAKQRPELYRVVAFLLIFLLLREINYGRTLACFADPADPNKFPKWKDIPYGWLAHVFVGIYLVTLAAVFILRKHWKACWELLRDYRLPLWECVILILAAVCAQITERFFHNDRIEELFELAFYSTAICIIWRYTRGKLRAAGPADEV